MEISKKVILTGHFGVGKTSLVQQFVKQKFSESYLTTIGVKVDKKQVDVDGAKVNLILWDLAGESSAIKVPKSYLLGTQGIIYVFDVSREETFAYLDDDLLELKKSMLEVPHVILGNKSDLMNEEDLASIKSKVPHEVAFTSAKENTNVEEAFLNLTKMML
ncbi:MAG: GTP-binding protein [Cyclobacteriaceae bacterium]|nr:GTP-binding protein [Cyclobacteriaceae bacterium HetDA_MAG_MS6]